MRPALLAPPARVEAVVPLPPSLNDRAAPARPAPAKTEKSETGEFRAATALDRMFAASDAQIGEKVRDLIAAKQLDKHLERANERKAVESFYAARNYAPLWIVRRTRSTRAPKQSSHASRTPPPMDSIRPIIRCRNSTGSMAPRRWPNADIKL